jgi:NUMOD3 motif
MQRSNDYYVYIVFRLSGIPCYVGKGRGGRWKQHFTKTHNQYLRNIIKKEGGANPVVLIRENMSEDDAFALERALIKALGRKDLRTGPLVNHTDGGDGSSNIAPEALARRNKAVARYWSNSENRKIAGDRARGRKHTEEAKAAISAKLSAGAANNMPGREKSPIFKKGVPLPKDILEKMRQSKLGKKRSPESRAKQGNTTRGRHLSAEHRAAIGRGNKGIPKHRLTDEEKRHLSTFVSSTKWWTAQDGTCYRAANKRNDEDHPGRTPFSAKARASMSVAMRDMKWWLTCDNVVYRARQRRAESDRPSRRP